MERMTGQPGYRLAFHLKTFFSSVVSKQLQKKHPQNMVLILNKYYTFYSFRFKAQETQD